MKTRTTWMVAALMAIAVPAWAHCGSCGVGETKGEKNDPGLAASGHTDHAHAHAEIGKPAPEFSLTAADGKTYKLADLKGRVVVLEWINHECPVVNRCHDSHIMTQTSAKFAGKPVTWLAIDSSHFCNDKVEGIRAWAKKQGINYPILLDANGKVGHTYAAKTTPHLFVIDQKGVLAYTGAINDDPYGSKGTDARNYVEEAITSLLAGSTVATGTTKPFGCGVKYKK